jgi:hypothetical protein
MIFTRNPDAQITTLNASTIDSTIMAGLATGMLTSHIERETNGILSLVFTYPEFTR